MRKLINLTLATDISGAGGISTVLDSYRQSGFLEKHNVRLIVTHRGENKFGFLGAGFLYISALVKLFFYLIFRRIGLVHIHMASRGSYIRKSLIVRLVKWLGGKVIIHLHGAEFREFYSDECNSRWQKHIRRTFDLADSVIVLSSHWITWAKSTLHKSDHVQVIYNAVPKMTVSRAKVRPGLVLFLGRIGQRKGVLELIRAFAQVVRIHPNACLKLGGDGNIKPYIQEVQALGLQEKVEFLGWVSGEKKRRLISEADVYCLPSYNEGFPMGILEAMSSGIPIVSTFAGGIPDAITHNEDGLLVEAGDVNALAGSIIALIEDRDLNRRLSEAALKKFDMNFSLDAIIPQLDVLYGKLLNVGDG
ncbi:glycosyltransferase family 4 protein [Microbulbifer yueqingensis]|uniref:Glycosyltransferase involved in cell wall bisynthesis n=1 Tax=Microbulbifer yueqingensis TaxID=658219 RepID=A0A1G8VLA7_9GAMM|nr:glycosyltransferase family 4 protein [Microbulbifer yueqingensis]SDJ66782.1 Glycosyltransferase involved in cell wall bisynthesis [Microbulbifer yueqingensis]